MKREDFDKLVEDAKSKKPILFGLEPDRKPEAAEIETVEEYYAIKLPQDYKDFLLKYGGGYFAFTVVYSLDEKSDFCLKNKVRPEFLEKNKFLPVIDFETGDVAGFKMVDGVCQNTISIYNHENAEMIDLNDDLYEVLAKYGISAPGR